ncbi:MAG: NAD(P)/FAD-dependent oxidoreductase [Pelagibacteraceae bacterium]|nr:NAD(P)/FAD-dependent oxidoreductase [Pelagibacteraceae bacterium]MCI5078986.1 NAD(P)/FAD-dependent oxidoreductase [Pelagibacteraceae bacterium]
MIKTDAVIVGAGPVGLFAVFELGIMGLNAHVIDNLDKVGGQCIELYPDKPIYDIPALPECTGESLTKNLLKQIDPFKTNFHLNQRVEKLEKKNNLWIVTTSDQNQFETPNIIIAAGVGSFEPRKPPIKDIEKFEKTNLFYSVKDKNKFKDQTVCIFGGGDSALDWTVELSKISKKIILVHRREEFRAAQHTVNLARELEKNGKVEILTNYQPVNFDGNDKIEKVVLKHDNGDQKEIATDSVLAFFGLKMELGPIANWGLDLEAKSLKVNTENFETNEKGIFAIGDICTYPGKLKLILSGFHESALCAQECFKRARPDEKYVFRFTTSSSDIQKRLGIK